MATPLEERVSRLEGAYEHLATKADLARLGGEVGGVLYQMERRIVRWMVAAAVISVPTAAGIATVLNHLLTAS